jgi:hypothetical protein
MNKLNTARHSLVVAALVEGNSVRAPCRMVDVAKGTVLSLLVDLGSACEQYQDRVLRNLKCRRIQCDEMWQYVYAKAKNVPEQHAGEPGYGDVWTWIAMDAASKLVPVVGGRSPRRIHCSSIHSRSGGPTRDLRAADDGWAQAVSRSCRGSLRERH